MLRHTKRGPALVMILAVTVLTLLPLLPALSSNPVLASTTPIVSSDGWGWQNPLPQGNTLMDIWGSSSTDVFAVGYSGIILHYDGIAWSEMSSGTSDDLLGIWGTSSSDVFAIGGGHDVGGGFILRYDGSTWSVMASSSTGVYVDVWGSSSSDVFAVGIDTEVGGGVIIHYNGTDWSEMSSATTELCSVWGSSSTDVFAVGPSGTILHYDGSAWESMSSGTSDDLVGVWGSSSSDVFAVGYLGTILHYDGTDWSAMSSGTTRYISDIWGSSSTDVFAAVNDGKVLNYNGTAWSEMSSGPAELLLGIWGSSSSDVFAVGFAGTVLHYSGSAWSVMCGGTSGAPFFVSGIWGSSPSDIFAVGADDDDDPGIIRHYNGTAWSTMPNTATMALYRVWGSSSSDVFAVGKEGIIQHFDGAGWSAMSSGTTSSLQRVWGSSSTDVFAVGGDGTILHYGGSAWSTMSSGTSNDLTAIWGSSSSDVFVGGDNGTILHCNGTSWSQMSSGATNDILGMWGSSASDVFAVGYDGPILHYDGVSWSQMGGATGLALLDVWGSSPSDIFAVGVYRVYGSTWVQDGIILHYDGSAWSEMSSGTANGLFGVWGSSSSDVLAVGFAGTILHYDDAPVLPNNTPNQPSNESPANAATGVGLTPTLQSSAFVDPDSWDTHAASQWQITSAAGNYSSPVFDSLEDSTHLTSITAPALNYSTTYYWRVTYKDNHGSWSSWSTETSFTTTGAPTDTTSPTTPVVTDDGATTTSTSQLHASWTSGDAESGVAEYQYAIGTTAGGTDVVGWTSVGTSTQVTKIGLSLTEGTTYYFSVKAKNGVGLWSMVGASDGIAVVAPAETTPPKTPVVTDDGDTTASTTQLHASWTSGDAESGVTGYQYSIGTTSGGTNVTDWTSVGANTQVTKTGLSLTAGTEYFISVKAKNEAGLWSEAGTSNGITVAPEGMAVEYISPAGGTVQTADGKITADFPANTAVGELTVIIDDIEPPSYTTEPKGFKAGSTYFVIGITDASGNPLVTLSQPITITMKYSDEDVAVAGGDPNNLVLAYYDEAAAEWNPLTTTVSTADKTLSATTKHLSTWGVLVKAAENNGLPFWIWIVGGVGTVAVFGSGILLWRRMAKKPVAAD